MTRRAAALAILALALAWSSRALAYPQFQLSRDTTCTDCHLSPAGGGLLSENGLVTAEAISQWGTSPEFLNGLVPAPNWLALGGDLRSAAGYSQREPSGALVYFPMQAELYAAASFTDAVSLHVTAGARDPQYGNTAATLFASREHWLQWQNAGGLSGLTVRVGRFMPVFGLRLAEHPAYDRQYGGTPLYGEAYAAAAEYVSPAWEFHATAFVHDPLQGSVELGNGAAVYAEARVASTTAIGVESKLDVTADDKKLHGGVVAKHYFADAGLPMLVQGELELVHQTIDAGGSDNQLVAYVLGSYFVGPLMIDLGLGAWDENLALRYTDSEVADLNVHWFATSHVELLVTNRLQMLELGAGGLTSGYSLLQLHYRL